MARTAKARRVSSKGKKKPVKRGKQISLKQPKRKPTKRRIRGGWSTHTGKERLLRAGRRFERDSVRWGRRMRELGLAETSDTQLKGTSLTKLQTKWYKQLADEGFDDIEWRDEGTGLGAASPYLKRDDRPQIRRGAANKLDYYRLCAAFRWHFTAWLRKPLKPGDKLIWKMHVNQDFTLREIAEAYSRYMSKPRSYFYVFTRIRVMEEVMMKWHETSSDGLLNPAADDFLVDEVLIRDPEPVPEA